MNKLAAYLHDHYKVWLNTLAALAVYLMPGLQEYAKANPKSVVAAILAINAALHVLPDAKSTVAALLLTLGAFCGTSQPAYAGMSLHQVPTPDEVRSSDLRMVWNAWEGVAAYEVFTVQDDSGALVKRSLFSLGGMGVQVGQWTVNPSTNVVTQDWGVIPLSVWAGSVGDSNRFVLGSGVVGFNGAIGVMEAFDAGGLQANRTSRWTTLLAINPLKLL